jgi:sucrose-6-phosphate hydrolase SacC (GH32 family)
MITQHKNKSMKRKNSLHFGCFILSALMFTGCQPGKKEVRVWDDALAVWHMSNLNDSTKDKSVLSPFGDVQVGVKLEGDDLKASQLRGGDGYVARLNGGWLDGGQGIKNELNFTGNAASFAIRVCDPQGRLTGPLMGKFGNDAGVAFSLTADTADSEVLFRAGLGSDEIAGMHRLKSVVAPADLKIWHDVVVRFDGSNSQLFVDGNLVDDEVSVGTIRANAGTPFLIGAEYADTLLKNAAASIPLNERIKSNFTGLIDHAAIWNRALTDAEIAQISGVQAIGDKRPAYYTEKNRPQFHFTPRKSWMNDPNGLVYYKGVYHMSYQHMPPGRPGAYKDWGQAISTDLVHWKILTSSLTPHKTWGGCWSGSAVVDHNNTTGFKNGPEDPIIAILTNGGVPGVGPQNTQCIAYSNDGGMTFTYYDKNPVLGHIVAENRDPKVVWFEPTKKWIMAIYLTGNKYGLFSSADMKSWEHICDLNLPGVTECPDLFEMAVDGNKDNKKWVFWGATGNYLVGSFDGKIFKPEGGLLKTDNGNSFYAAQTWSNIPDSDGRRIQIAWMADGVFGPKAVKLKLGWDQQMNFPTEVKLRTTPAGIRMFRLPVKELELLHNKESKWSDVSLTVGKNLFDGISGELFDIRMEIDPVNASTIDIDIRGEKVRYDHKKNTLTCLGRTVPLTPENGRIKLQILVDRTSLEVFGNDGLVVLTSCFLPADENKNISLTTGSGAAKVISAHVYTLHSIWQQ